MLKLLKVVVPNVSNATFYTNNSNAYVLLIGLTADYTGNLEGFIELQDSYGNSYDRIMFMKAYSNTDDISESGSFSTTASTSQGITSTSESISGSISRDTQVFVVRQKILVPPNCSVYAFAVVVYGFIAIQADSLEELRGFL